MNDKDSLAVCIEKHGQVVGHVPCNLSPLLSTERCQQGDGKDCRAASQQGACMGIEVPCISHLFSPKKYPKKLEEVIKNDFSSVKLREK